VFFHSYKSIEKINMSQVKRLAKRPSLEFLYTPMV
jgi:hypothetical protein